MTNKKLEDFDKQEFKHGVVYLGDAREILPLLKEDIADVCVTSPPYNLNKRYTNYDTSKTSKAMTEKYKKWYPDELPELEYRDQQREMIDILTRSCKSSIFYNHRDRPAWHGRTLPENRPPSNIHCPWDIVRAFHVWCTIIWDRLGIGNPVANRYHSQFEYIYQIQKPTKFYQKRRELSYKNILHTEEDENNIPDYGPNQMWGINPSKNEGHVCTYPEKMVEHCIFPTTDIGDTVIDPYLGSGTTAIVAVKHGRKFIGIEIDPEYFESSCKKIAAAEEERAKLEKEGSFYFQPQISEPFDMAKIHPDGLERLKGKLGTPVRAWIKKEEKRIAKEKAIKAVIRFFQKIGKEIRMEEEAINSIVEFFRKIGKEIEEQNDRQK